MKLTFNEVVARIAETYREDAEEHNCDNCDEVFTTYHYDSEDIKDEIIYSYEHDFTEGEMEWYEDDCSVICADGEFTYRQIVKAVKKYAF
jgi:hypothetical protein